MEVQKVIVNQDLTASIKCPLCGNIKSFDVRKFKGKGRNLKVKCTCDTLFPISIDFRRSFRKPVNLPGSYAKVPHRGTWSNMMVVDISMTGVAINPTGGHNISIGEELRIKFILNDADGSLVDKNIKVVTINGSKIGCEFVDLSFQDKTLARYLIS